MKLTQKDKTFLETLKQLMDSKDIRVELKPDRPSYMVLRGTYGEKIHRAFRMTRQGVRWRFWRVLNDIYVSAFTTILFIEKTFGTQLRDHFGAQLKIDVALGDQLRDRLVVRAGHDQTHDVLIRERGFFFVRLRLVGDRGKSHEHEEA